MFESEFEQNLYTLRREKLKQIAALGQLAGLNEAQATYPNSFSTSHTIPEVRAAFDELSTEQLELNSVPITVRVAGRIMAIRVQGKAGFAQLQQGGQRLQIYVRKDDVGENAFAIYKLLDLGDHIGVSGHLFRTRTGELTVHVSTITFLTKAMLALPDKFHGLADTELRYRQRYVDLFMNTGALRPATNPGTTNPGATNPGAPGLALADLGEAPQASPEPTEEDSPRNVREVFVKRAAVLRAIRRFFDQLGYLEVETPMMQQIPGGAAARPFTTHHNELDLDLYLRIAPELYLKRLVVGGLDRVYEINRNFRNEGMSTRHNPEFTMLEFYQAYANYHDLMRLTEELIIFVAEEVNGTTITHFNGNEIDLSKWQRYSMREAIIHFWPESAGARPDPSVFDSTESVVALVHQLRAAKVSIVYEPGEPVGKTIATVFETVAGEHLIQPTIIYDFPLAISPLSKIKHDEPDWVERFEFFIGGFEVGNAFSELNDPEDQRRRFLDQLEQKERGDHEAHHMDEDYIRALGYGLPPTAGEGIGIDRLTMLLTNSRSIRDVILFPLMRPQTKPQQSSSSSPAISLDSLDSLDKPHGESAE